METRRLEPIGTGGMLSIDIIDSAAFVSEAVARIVDRRLAALHVAVKVDSWLEYLRMGLDPAHIVVLRAELRDHVPAAIKVRALRRVGSLPIVAMHEESEAHRLRLLAEGAFRVIHGDQGLAELITAIRDASVKYPGNAEWTMAALPTLTEREAQIACLFAGRASPSASRIAELLGISHETARVHLARARKRLNDPRTSSRSGLREVLIEQGWLHESL